MLEEALRPLRADLEEIRARLSATRKDFFTVEEIAKMAGRSAYTIRRWISDKRLKATRIAGTGPKGRLLIRREEVQTLIASGLGAKIPDASVG